MARVRWTTLAIRDLRDVWTFVAEGSEDQADILADRLIAKANSLAVLPGKGRVVPEFREPNIRELIEGKYRIVYRLKNSEIQILCIWHSARRSLPFNRFE